MAYKILSTGTSYRTHRPVIRNNFATLAAAMSGDIVMTITPATATPLPTAAAWTRNVVISVEDSAGNRHAWLNGTFTTTLSIADDSTAGTASIVSTTLTIVAGVATVVVSGDEAAWLDTEKDTLTVGNITVLGVTVTGGTSIQTFTAA